MATTVEGVLTRADAGLGRVDAAIDTARTATSTIEGAVMAAGDRITSTDIAFTVVERTVGEQLFPPLTEAAATMTAVVDTVVAANDALEAANQLPFVNVVIEEAPSILNPDRLKFGSIFRDISRQGRKFGIGLTVVSQQVGAIDSGVLTQINTELTMSLGNENERREAIRNASADLMGFERELQVMARGQLLVTGSYNDVPLPIQVPNFDSLP